MEQIAIIADDLTGANDTGIQFSKFGLSTAVVIDYQTLDQMNFDKEVWVINSESRPLAPEEAYQRVFGITQRLKEVGFKNFYKKIDSTLRGHPGAELEAVMDALGAELAVVVPSFPANGRLVVNGNLYLLFEEHQVELGEGKIVCHVPSVLQKEMKRQVANVNLSLVREGSIKLAQKLEALHQAGQQVIVIDAAIEEDLAVISAAVGLLTPKTVISGAAGLAAHLPVECRHNPFILKETLPEGTLLVVAGSRNSLTATQIKELVKVTKAPVLQLLSAQVLAGHAAEEKARLIDNLGQLLKEPSPPPILVLAVDSLFTGVKPMAGNGNVLPGKRIAKVLGEIVAQLVLGQKVRGLILTGGDTAVHVCQNLEAKGIELMKELQPGIPLCKLMGGKAQGMQVVTKAGGFGQPDAFLKVYEALNHATAL